MYRNISYQSYFDTNKTDMITNKTDMITNKTDMITNKTDMITKTIESSVYILTMEPPVSF